MKMRIQFFPAFLWAMLMPQDSMSQNTPEEITKDFIKAYQKWNDNAFRLHSSNNPLAGETSEKEYKTLIEKYCGPHKTYQFLAFGSHSGHTPEEELITGSKTRQNKAIVKTKFKDKNADYLVNYYEYHFVKKNGKWLLEEVYLLDEGKKYPGL